MNLPDPDVVNGNDTVRRKALELERASRRARAAGIALNATIGLLMVIAAVFSAWNTYRLKELTQDNRALFRLVQDYNEAHATAAGESFNALNDSTRCMFDWMADYNAVLAARASGSPQPLPERATLDACYRPTTPQPAPPPPEPKERKP